MKGNTTKNHVLLVIPSPPWDENHDGVTKIVHNLVAFSKYTKFSILALSCTEGHSNKSFDKEFLSKNIASYDEIFYRRSSRFARLFESFFSVGLANEYIGNKLKNSLINNLARLSKDCSTIHFVSSKFISLLNSENVAERRIVFSLIDNNQIYLERRRSLEGRVKSMWTALQIDKTRKLYDRYAERSNIVWSFVSDLDGLAFKKNRNCQVAIIENGVRIPSLTNRNVDNEFSSTIVFHGNMVYLPNVMARNYIFEFSKKHVDLEFLIFGINCVDNANSSSNLSILNEVKDLGDHLTFGGIYFAPLVLGAGIKNKILEAMSYGMCVVTTSIGIEGINPPEDTVEIVDVSDPETIYQRISQLILDLGLRRRRGSRARSFVVENFGWEAKVNAYERLYE